MQNSISEDSNYYFKTNMYNGIQKYEILRENLTKYKNMKDIKTLLRKKQRRPKRVRSISRSWAQDLILLKVNSPKLIYRFNKSTINNFRLLCIN
jgi:hypothetical protein